MSLKEDMMSMELISKSIQLQLKTGDLEWDSNEVQFFIPAALYFTNFEWLELIAENNLVEEDTIVVKNFLAMVRSLMDINGQQLHENVKDKIDKLMGD